MKGMNTQTMYKANKSILLTLCLIFMGTLNVLAGDVVSYGFDVAGFEVKSNNYTDIKPNGLKSGKVTYNPTTNTVTFNNVEISRDGKDHRAIHNKSCKDLTIEFVGSNTLYAEDAAPVRLETHTSLYVGKGLTRIIGDYEDGIYITNEKEPSIIDIFGDPDGNLEVYAYHSCAIKSNPRWDGAVSQVFFYDPYVILEGKKGDFVNIDAYINWNSVVLPRQPEGYVHLAATEDASNPNVINSRIYFGNTDVPTVIISPWGATVSGTTVKYNGTTVYNYDIVMTNNYAALLTEDYFPDANFRDYLDDNYFSKSVLYVSDLDKVTSINVDSKSISTLAGIEYFSKLTQLSCKSNSLQSLDLSKNTALTTLDCSSNNLTSLTGIGSKVTSINCSNNKLTTLNCSNKTSLQTLSCNGNLLTSLYCNGCTSLTSLKCFTNRLKTLNLSGCTNLTSLQCYSNRISNMDDLIESLYDRKGLSAGILYAFLPTSSAEQNVVTKKNVNDAKLKNWKTYQYVSGSWSLYEGVSTISTDITPIDNTIDEATPLYNLSGQRVGSNYKGVVITKDKKVRMK